MLQDSTILKNLVEMKRLPVLFIGSGFSKRYLKKAYICIFIIYNKINKGW